MIPNRQLASLGFAPLCCFALACASQQGVDMGQGSEMGQVAGKVTYKGQPLTRGTVSFMPSDGKGSPASAEITSDGSYQLQTFQPGDGARPGEYRISVRTGGEDLSARAADKSGKPAEISIQSKYEDPMKSGLTASVKAGKNDFNFELK
jgi:hypothetical protein